MPDWTRRSLDWMLAKRFSRVIREGDRIECLSSGMSPWRSMEWAINQGGGESWAAMVGDSEVPSGVYGWTKAGAVWSYWRDLTRPESIELVRRTPQMVVEMVENSGRDHLANYVWEKNKEALDWLTLCGCFSLDLDHRYNISNRQFIGFQTKPLEELRKYV